MNGMLTLNYTTFSLYPYFTVYIKRIVIAKKSFMSCIH